MKLKLQLADGARRWRAAAARFDARAERERWLMLAAGLAVLWMLLDALWLGPATRAWQQARVEQRSAQERAATLASDAQRLVQLQQAQAQHTRAELAQWRERVRAGEAALRAHEATLVGPERMLPLLQDLLAGHGRVRVRAMQVLPRVDLLAADALSGAASTPAPGAGLAGAVPSLYRHGVELTLEGSFPDLLGYLQALDALPQRLLWGGMQFKVEKHPVAVLTLQLSTLSLERSWLEI